MLSCGVWTCKPAPCRNISLTVRLPTLAGGLRPSRRVLPADEVWPVRADGPLGDHAPQGIIYLPVICLRLAVLEAIEWRLFPNLVLPHFVHIFKPISFLSRFSACFGPNIAVGVNRRLINSIYDSLLHSLMRYSPSVSNTWLACREPFVLS